VSIKKEGGWALQKVSCSWKGSLSKNGSPVARPAKYELGIFPLKGETIWPSQETQFASVKGVIFGEGRETCCRMKRMTSFFTQAMSEIWNLVTGRKTAAGKEGKGGLGGGKEIRQALRRGVAKGCMIWDRIGLVTFFIYESSESLKGLLDWPEERWL